MKKLITNTVTLILIWPTISLSTDVPSSRRSIQAIAKVRPKLTKELIEKGLHFGAHIYIRIFKESTELELWVKNSKKFNLFKTYQICFFSGDLGPKLRVGDHQSPEGFYFVKPNQLNPYSQFHLSFNLGYPNAYDRSHGRTGSALMVHGNCVSVGCYAMTNKRIEEIYAMADAALRNGQPFFRVHIFPFRMTEKNMKQCKNSKWYSFWENLKEGHDIFEEERLPPNVIVKNKIYKYE